MIVLSLKLENEGGDRIKNPVFSMDSGENSVQEKYRKMIITGTVIEIYEMDSKPYQLFRRPISENESPDWIEDWENELDGLTLQERVDKCETMEQIERIAKEERGRIASNVYRTRNSVRRLALANFDNEAKFVTFTFAKHVTDIAEANKAWKKFIGRMRYRYGAFHYIAVIEFTKIGRVHYHCIWDLPFVKKSELQEIWGNGFIKINAIDHVDNVGAYIVKYMTKELMDPRLKGYKAYQCSKGLNRPLIVRGAQLEELYAMYDLEHKKTVFESSYTSEHHGTIHYKEYNLKRQESKLEKSVAVMFN